MFIDIDSVEFGANYHCFVVGTGPAGMAIATELARKNKRVLMFESGHINGGRHELSNSVGYGHYSNGYWNRHQIRMLGGTSNVWSGWCAVLDEVDFRNPSIGVRWPITYRDLYPYYLKAAPFLDREELIVGYGKPSRNFNYKPFSVAKPTRVGSKFKSDIKSSKLIDVLLDCTITNFDTNPTRTLIREMTCFLHATGKHRQIPVKEKQSVVLAAGGIGNAQLLLQPSRNDDTPVGNESNMVGKYIMEHPHFNNAGACVVNFDINQFSPPDKFGPHRHAIQLLEEDMLAQGLYGCSIELTDDAGVDEPVVRSLEQKLGKNLYMHGIRIRSEMKPSSSNRVSLLGEKDETGLHRPMVQCVLDRDDFLNVENTLRLLALRFMKASTGRIRINNDNIYKDVRGGGHTMGTTRIGHSRQDSVADAHCRIHGYHNFYLAGSSVFPTGGAANPTLTIVALAMRLADTIAN